MSAALPPPAARDLSLSAMLIAALLVRAFGAEVWESLLPSLSLPFSMSLSLPLSLPRSLSLSVSRRRSRPLDRERDLRRSPRSRRPRDRDRRPRDRDRDRDRRERSRRRASSSSFFRKPPPYTCAAELACSSRIFCTQISRWASTSWTIHHLTSAARMLRHKPGSLRGAPPLAHSSNQSRTQGRHGLQNWS